MPPPFTPSPRRFASPQRKAVSRSASKVRHSSSLRDEVRLDGKAAEENALKGDASEQFATTPRLSSSRKAEARSISQQPSRYESTTKARPPTSRSSDQDCNTKQQGHNNAEQAQRAVEPSHDSADLENSGYDLPLSPKRRRLEHEVDAPSTLTSTSISLQRSLPKFSRPTQKAPGDAPSIAPKRFLHSTPMPTVVDKASVTASPFLFRPPDTKVDSTLVSPLPEAFSPHRRGARFQHGGMASTMQQWILETSQAATNARRAQASSANESFAMRVTLSDPPLLSDSSFPLFVSGTGDNDQSISLALIGELDQAPEITAGQIIALREPCWHVHDGTRQWLVCVDWKFLA